MDCGFEVYLGDMRYSNKKSNGIVRNIVLCYIYYDEGGLGSQLEVLASPFIFAV